TFSPKNPVPGQTITVTAIFTPHPPAGGLPNIPGQVPTGNATFTLDGVIPANGTVTLNAAGQAIYTVSVPTATQHRVRVSYAGDGNFTGSATNFDTLVTVNKGTALIQIAANPLTSVFGQKVTFTAAVSGAVLPTGTVTFYKDSISQANVLASNVPL